MIASRGSRRRCNPSLIVVALGVALVLVALMPAAARSAVDPRLGLSAGWLDAGSASSGMELLAHNDRPAGFFNPANVGSLSFANSDIAFSGKYAFAGSFHGFNVYDLSNPASPSLRTSVVCPGGQGDMSVWGNLLFMSVEETRGKIDCTLTPAATPLTRFRGVRIFDISNIGAPVQIAAVQTCRGSHTHTIVTNPSDTDNIYVYVSGTAGIRAGTELAGCNGNSSLTDPTTANFRIDVIKVPLAAPQNAAVVSNPRLFSKCGSSACEGDFAVQEQHPDPRYGIRGALNWLNTSGTQPTYPADDPRAPGGQSVSQSVVCHDITAYPEIGLAAGACQGDGILIDISDPVHPVRIDNVTDFNFAYWHSATFNNDGTKVIFTDEWGGGTGARCRVGDRPNWGANAIFDIVDRKLVFRSYYKLPVVQTSQENCVAHNGSLVPVPGRDVMSQAWYQGGISVFDFTDSANPKELAFFDRGPISATSLVTGGMWSGYWYNGFLYGTEIARGFDAFGLTPTDALSENEIAAASEPKFAQFNAQLQPRITWAPSYALVRAYRDQVVRTGTVDAETLATIDKFVDRAERFSEGHQTSAAQAQLHALANQLDGEQYATLRSALRALSDASAPFKPKHVPAKANAKKPSFAGLPPQIQDEAPAEEPAAPPAE
jgi:LVIVD repeat-containing protein